MEGCAVGAGTWCRSPLPKWEVVVTGSTESAVLQQSRSSWLLGSCPWLAAWALFLNPVHMSLALLLPLVLSHVSHVWKSATSSKSLKDLPYIFLIIQSQEDSAVDILFLFSLILIFYCYSITVCAFSPHPDILFLTFNVPKSQSQFCIRKAQHFQSLLNVMCWCLDNNSTFLFWLLSNAGLEMILCNKKEPWMANQHT